MAIFVHELLYNKFIVINCLAFIYRDIDDKYINRFLSHYNNIYSLASLIITFIFRDIYDTFYIIFYLVITIRQYNKSTKLPFIHHQTE